MSDDGRPVAEFYFDYSCPWSYLALVRLREAAMRTASRIDWRPVLLNVVHQHSNPEYPASREDPNPVKAAYQVQDLNQWARFCGIRIRKPSAWPAVSEWAQRGGVAALHCGRCESFSLALFQAYFLDDRDIRQPDVILEVAGEAGLELERFRGYLGSDDTMRELERNTSGLLERGGFGVPTIMVGDELYFGNDRMPLVEAALHRAGDIDLVVPGDHSRV